MALNVRPGVEVELSVSGNTLKGPRRRNAQPADQSSLERLRDVRRLYHHRRGASFFSLQNIINKKFIIENGSTIQWTGSPMDAMLISTPSTS